MGVTGLWELLRPAAKTRSLAELAITEGFKANPDGKRGFRIGIDASIWFFHAEYGKEGENPVLRTLFFRCATLMHTTFLPIFVFDGPKRPDVKRGKKINKTGHKLIPGMKNIIEAFGFEWRMAPGEAEAELAYLNRIGVIDGVLSDDVDNFLFGATTVIRNSSNTLSGNKANPALNSAGKDDKNHTRVFRSKDLEEHPDVRLTRGGMILIGLLAGGDYHTAGVPRCGKVTAHGLAKCGFGDSLYDAAVNLDREDLAEFIVHWRRDLVEEIRTNSMGEIGKKQAVLANSFPADFPDIDILLSYVKPITSESMGRESNNLLVTWSREPDLGKLAATCELYFEWGYKEAIIKRFRTIMWHPIVLRILRRAVLDRHDNRPTGGPFPSTPRKGGAGMPCGTPSKMIAQKFSSMEINTERTYISGSESEDEEEEGRLIVKVHGKRKHTSTDGLLEYRLEIAPKQLVQLAESGVKGLRSPEGPDEWASEPEADDDEEGEAAALKKRGKGPTAHPHTHWRVWMPACMVQIVEPGLVKEFEDIENGKAQKKAQQEARKAAKLNAPPKAVTVSKSPKKSKKKSATNSGGEGDEGIIALPKKTTNHRKAMKKSTAYSVDHDGDDEAALSMPDVPTKASDKNMRKSSIDDFEDIFSSPLSKKPQTDTTGKSKLSSLQFNRYDDIPPLSSDDEDELPSYLMVGKKPSFKGKEPAINFSDDDEIEIIESTIKPHVDPTRKKLSEKASTNITLKSFFPVGKSTGAKNPKSSASSSGSSSRASSSTSATTYSSNSSDPCKMRIPSVASSSTTVDDVLVKSKGGKQSRGGNKKASADKAPKTKRPFSVDTDDSSCGEYDTAAWAKGRAVDVPVPAISSPSKRKSSKSWSSPSESDSQDRVKKSPRKKLAHASPKPAPRPVSPSPGRVRLPIQPLWKISDEVIDISTDAESDHDLPGRIRPQTVQTTLKFPLAPKTKFKPATECLTKASVSSKVSKTFRRKAHTVIPDVIDLT